MFVVYHPCGQRRLMSRFGHHDPAPAGLADVWVVRSHVGEDVHPGGWSACAPGGDTTGTPAVSICGSGPALALAYTTRASVCNAPPPPE